MSPRESLSFPGLIARDRFDDRQVLLKQQIGISLRNHEVADKAIANADSLECLIDGERQETLVKGVFESTTFGT